MPVILPVDPRVPQQDIIEKAGKIILQNKMVIFPASCLYGIAVDATNPGAIEKVFKTKARARDNPLLVLIPDISFLTSLVTWIPQTAQVLMDAFWPGNLTLVFNAAECVSPLISSGTGKIGIRLPAHPVALALVKKAGRPVTGTSANPSGTPGVRRIADLHRTILDNADMVLDAGPLKGGNGSSVVDITGRKIRIIREGVLTAHTIHSALNTGKIP